MASTAKTPVEEDAAADVERVKEDLAALKADLARLAKGLKDEATGQISEKASAIYDKLREEGDETTEALARHVRERPLASLGIALAVGFVLGRLLSR